MENNIIHAFRSKYPEIVVDKNPNSIIADKMIKKLTVEEYYDIMHHTHTSSDITGGEEAGATITQMQTKVEELNTLVTEMETVIQTQDEAIKTLEKTIEEIREVVTNATTVADWDVTKPGNQDIEGNDVDVLTSVDVSDI